MTGTWRCGDRLLGAELVREGNAWRWLVWRRSALYRGLAATPLEALTAIARYFDPWRAHRHG